MIFSHPAKRGHVAGTGQDGIRAFLARRSRAIAWLLFGAFCAVWFGMLGARTLVPTDEGRYAEIAREMAVSGDFVTSRVNGIKYFGKPPLQAWMTALTFRAFGTGEWQARLWTGLCGLLGIAAVYHAGRRVYNERTGLAAALVLGSCWYWSVAGHVGSYDMSLSAMMALALCAFLCAQRSDATPRERRNWMLLCWGAMALAVLSKGLAGIVLPGAALILYSLAARDRAVWTRLHVVPGLLLFSCIAAPWFVLVSIRNPEFPQFFFLREHVARFTSNVHLRAEPWYYFLPLLLAGAWPWTGVLAQSLRNGARAVAGGIHGPGGFQPGRLLLAWVACIFVFFSMSKAKLPAYILPLFPALALLVAAYLDRASHRATVLAAGVAGAAGALVLVLLAMAPASEKLRHALALHAAYLPWLAAAGMLAVAGGGLAAWLARSRREWALAVLAGAGFLGSQALMLGHEPYGREKAGVDHLPAIRAALAPDMPVYAVGAYEYALPFYLGRTTTMVAHAEDGMQLGLQQEPALWIPQLDTFVAAWTAGHASGSKAMAFMRPDIHAGLRARGVPMRVIAQDRRRVIVVNDAR